MIKFSRFLIAFMACAFVLPINATLAQAAPEILIKIGHNSPSAENQALPWHVFKEYVEKESKGRIGVEIYGSASMGACLESAEKVQMNILQMHAGSTSNLSALIPEWGIFELPYLLQNTLDNEKIFYENGKLGGPVFERMDKLMRAKGLKMIFIMPATFRAMGVIKPDAEVPSDLEGLKIRVTASRIERDSVTAFDMNPTTMAFGEVYTGLQQGTIDGLGLAVDSMYLNKFNEVLKSVITNKFNAFFMVASVNEKFYNKLPSWAKTVVDGGIAAGIKAANEKWDEYEQSGEEKFKADGIEVYHPTAAEMKEWQALTQPVYDKYSKELNQEMLTLVKQRLTK